MLVQTLLLTNLLKTPGRVHPTDIPRPASSRQPRRCPLHAPIRMSEHVREQEPHSISQSVSAGFRRLESLDVNALDGVCSAKVHRLTTSKATEMLEK